MRELSWITRFDDGSFLLVYVLGMSILFWADPAPRFILRRMEPLNDREVFRIDVDVHNARILARAKSGGDIELDRASWEKSAAEFADGSLQGPYFSLDEVKKSMVVCGYCLVFQFGNNMVGARRPRVGTSIMVCLVSKIISVGICTRIVLLTWISLLVSCVMSLNCFQRRRSCAYFRL